MNHVIFILFFVFAGQSFGQSYTQKDSIGVFNLINKANHYFTAAAYDSALYYSEKAGILAKQKNFKPGIAFAGIKKAEIYIDTDALDKADKVAAQTQLLGEKLQDSLVMSIAIMQKAQVRMYRNEIAEALVLFKTCIENYFAKHPSEYAALAYNDYGYALGLHGQLTEKVNCLFKALEIYESMPQLNHGEVAITYNNISMVYYELGQRKKAVEYGEKSIEHRKLDDNIEKLALGYCNLSQMYRGLDDQKSKYYQSLCVEYAEKSGNQDRIIHAYITSALMESDSENREAAITFEKKAVAVLEQNQDNPGMLAKRYLALGMHCIALNKSKDLTLSYLNKALELSKSVKDKTVISETYNQLSDFYQRQKMYREALESKKKYYIYRDSVITETTNSTIADLETKYETAKKEKEIDSLMAQNQISRQQKKTQTYLFSGVLMLIGISGLFLFYTYRNKLKTVRKLKELDTLKSRFFANISHEFRTPLTLIKSPLQLLQSEENDVSRTRHLSMIEQHCERMLSLVDQLLQLSKIDSGQLKLLLQRNPLSSFLETLVEPFALSAAKAGFIFEKQIEKTESLQWFDKDILEKIISNLLSNALKYTPQGEYIGFVSKIGNNQLHLTVKNTAEDIQNKDISRLFERFYQEKHNSEGAGIGLALVKELITLYKGKLTAKTEGRALVLNIRLPLDIETLKDVSVITAENTDEIPWQKATTGSEDLPLLLVADDHADIRRVLKDLFQKEYHILEASDGVSALKIAVNEIPDIIISDVTMPNMDGFELVQALKQNDITSSVPIILLTAQTSDESHLKGLQYEADDYITKPFNHNILKTKVRQLIEVRHKLRERYSKELVLKPNDITITSADEKFIGRLQDVLDKELSNAGFSADDFARTVGMSRMQLHRKLKTLLGVSATEFLRSERIKAAAVLLKKDALNISEIAYHVGFNDISYFSKCFKETLGATPSEYAAKA